LAVSLAAGGLIAPAALGQDAFPFSDNFDSYTPGVFPCATGGCAGPNGWSIWYSGGSPGAIVSGIAHSGTNALQINAASDITQTGSITSGQWTMRAFTYIPTGVTGTGYFIVMHNYNGSPSPAPAPVDQWSIQVQFNATTNTVVNYNTAVTIAPLVRDQWVEARAEINLTTNTFDFYYGSTQVITGATYSTVGTPAIACWDLYGETINGMLLDTVSVAPAGGTGCYANCDGSTTPPVANVADFTCFLQKFAAGDPYANCDGSTTPPTINVADFTCFLQKFAAGCP